MNKQRRRKAEALLKELSAIQVELEVLKGEEAAAFDSIVTVLEVEALGEAVSSVEQAIGALKEAVA